MHGVIGKFKYGFDEMIVGESKQSCIFRELENQIYNRYKNVNSLKYLKSIKIAKKVAEYYCGFKPQIAFIDIDLIKELKVNKDYFSPETEKRSTNLVDSIKTRRDWSYEKGKTLEGIGFTDAITDIGVGFKR